MLFTNLRVIVVVVSGVLKRFGRCSPKERNSLLKIKRCSFEKKSDATTKEKRHILQL